MRNQSEISTIGYGGKSPREFFNELEALDPEIVIDVRANPFKAFLNVYTKPYLEDRLKNRYIWIEELGNQTRSLPPTLIDEEVGLRKVRELMSNNHRIVLLCAEKDESKCHRIYIKSRLLEDENI